MRQVLSRIVSSIITLALVSVLAFAAFNIIPGDPALVALGTEASQEQLDELRVKYGYDKPPFERYFLWLSGLVKGQLGDSFRYHRSISSLLEECIPITLWLSAISLALILAMGIGAPIGAAISSSLEFSARSSPARKKKHAGRLVESLLMSTCAIGMSIPEFLAGILCVWVFGLTLKWFTPGLFVPKSESFSAFASYLVFPAFSIAMPCSAMLCRGLYASLKKEMSSPYIMAVYSKGASATRALFSHALKNAIVQNLALFASIVAFVLSGSIITEKVFSIPGIGLFLVSAVSSRDLPLAQSIVMYIAFCVVLANALIDVAIALIDPRLRRS
ncbi:MAG: ABC transporter permease [Eubacteriaceae bacterium]|nr:ABC transporter permease [Eubacteriaceae bacterium]